MKNLNFGCRRSDFLFSPPDFETISKTTNSDWFVMCRFYEPNQEKPFVYKRKINKFKSLTDRKKIMKLLKSEMQDLLDKKDYNPRTKQFMFQTGKFHPHLNIIEALNLALTEKDYTVGQIRTVKCEINKLEKGLYKMNYEWLKINEIELLHIKKSIEIVSKTNNSFNAMKKNLSPLFNILINEGCLKINPCLGIMKKKHLKKDKELLSTEEINKIRKHIIESFPYFQNFFEIFFYSGSRVPELLGVQKKDVNLEKKEFLITVKKGGVLKRDIRAIVPDAFQFWEDQMKTALFDDDYIFSYHYYPGGETMNREVVYRFWKRNLINTGVTNKTIYTLKHTFLDFLEENMYNAQFMAGHTSDRTTQNYVLGRKRRELEILKTAQFKKPDSNL